MNQLTQKYISAQATTAPPPPTIPFVKPVSYEFRVAEHYDVENKLTKVALQVQVWEHDEFGSGTVKHYWQDVPRIKIDAAGSIIPPV